MMTIETAESPLEWGEEEITVVEQVIPTEILAKVPREIGAVKKLDTEIVWR